MEEPRTLLREDIDRAMRAPSEALPAINVDSNKPLRRAAILCPIIPRPARSFRHFDPTGG